MLLDDKISRENMTKPSFVVTQKKRGIATETYFLEAGVRL